MNKIPTVFKRDLEDLSKVTREVHPDCEWVLDGEGTATRKYDGTCIGYLWLTGDGPAWWARREVKPGKRQPGGFISVTTDEVTGKTMGWEPVEGSAYFKYVIEAHRNFPDRQYRVGTYELIGPKVQGNPEQADKHMLMLHADAEQLLGVPRDFDGLAKWMADTDFEGIVWHHPDGRMAKLKRRDF